MPDWLAYGALGSRCGLSLHFRGSGDAIERLRVAHEPTCPDRGVRS